MFQLFLTWRLVGVKNNKLSLRTSNTLKSQLFAIIDLRDHCGITLAKRDIANLDLGLATVCRSQVHVNVSVLLLVHNTSTDLEIMRLPSGNDAR